MSAQITEQKILEALKSVRMPGQNSDISTAEAVSNIVVKDGNVGFTIEISPEQAGAADSLKADAENAVNAINGVLSVSVILTAHKPAVPSTSQAPVETVKEGAGEDLLKPARHVVAVASKRPQRPHSVRVLISLPQHLL